MRGIRIMLVAAILAVGLVGMAGPALAAEGSAPGAEVQGDVINTGSNGGTGVLGGSSSTPSGVLPFTGAQITGFLVVALLAIGTGVVLVRRTGSGIA